MKQFLTPLLRSFFIPALALTAFAGADLDRADKEFIKDTYENGLAEVKFAEMAGAKGTTDDVKKFATTMATDHGKLNTELKSLADTKKVEVAKDLTVVGKAKVKMLDMKAGADFDKAFAEGMVDSHKKSVKAFEKVANEAKDADVKALATKTLPTLKHHLTMAEELQAKVGKK
jgi:putative membrane protein